jgi:hypothetical protein
MTHILRPVTHHRFKFLRTHCHNLEGFDQEKEGEHDGFGRKYEGSQASSGSSWSPELRITIPFELKFRKFPLRTTRLKRKPTYTLWQSALYLALAETRHALVILFFNDEPCWKSITFCYQRGFSWFHKRHYD